MHTQTLCVPHEILDAPFFAEHVSTQKTYYILLTYSPNRLHTNVHNYKNRKYYTKNNKNMQTKIVRLYKINADNLQLQKNMMWNGIP